MKLLILFDHRFHRDPEGGLRSKTHYNAELFRRRYLGVFDEVNILARVDGGARGVFRLGESVNLVSLGDWNSMTRFFMRRRQVWAIIERYLKEETAVLMIAPGAVGNMAIPKLTHWRRPYGVEVVGNPADAFAAGAVQHPMRAIIRYAFCRKLRQACRHASSAIYVTNRELQRAYPPGPKTLDRGASDIELGSDAFVRQSRVVTPKNEWRIVHVGSMAQPYKAHDVLIDAVAACRRQGLDLHLALLGDGALRAQFEQQSHRLGLNDHVEFLGHLPPGEMVRQQLDRADLFVLPSRTEGLPRATLEAMARALPCISTSVGGNPELLDGTELVTPGDTAALAEKLTQVLNDPARMTRLSDRNLSLAREYRYEVLHERRLQAYRHLHETTWEWFRRDDMGTHSHSGRRAA